MLGNFAYRRKTQGFNAAAGFHQKIETEVKTASGLKANTVSLQSPRCRNTDCLQRPEFSRVSECEKGEGKGGVFFACDHAPASR